MASAPTGDAAPAAGSSVPYSKSLSEATPSLQKLKLIFLGDFGVGKTTLFHHIRTGHFLEGAHFLGQQVGMCEKTVTLKHHRSNRQVQISLWDTAGEERFLSLSNCYYRDADAVLLTYSLHSPSSFDSLSHWLFVARQHCVDADIFLLGNKSDLESCIPEEKVEKFATEHNASGRFKVSAKTGENVDRCLQEVVEQLFMKNQAERSDLHPALQEGTYYSPCRC